MPHVSANDDPLLDRLVFGYDGTNYRVVKVDTSGNLVAALLAGSTIEVTQDTAADLNATATLAANQNVQARGYGWVGGAWQKQPLSLGYSGNQSGQATKDPLVIGTNTGSFGTVPTGELQVLTGISMKYAGTSPTVMSFGVSVGGLVVIFFSQLAPVSEVWYAVAVEIVLEPGDYYYWEVRGATAGDDIDVRQLGYRVDIDQ